MRLAACPEWSTRARAAEALASHAADPHAAALHTLLLDGEDTAVPRTAAAALCREVSIELLRLVAAALADEKACDWVFTGKYDALARQRW
ncbi:hypothetical protein HCN52_14090 [Streptomyces bohaiensis]|uniref:HEAT repeat domain-containing protein n=1 Tax=Streptomyces bohaiensis TaxID=1431344 RepID=A0ABX1CCP2_9ACTN|nr:hypothetical protein [Streptomyces bohaiensis]